MCAVIDSGFKQPVRAMSYEGVTMTRDNMYLLPDGAWGSPMYSCYRTQVMQVCGGGHTRALASSRYDGP